MLWQLRVSAHSLFLVVIFFRAADCCAFGKLPPSGRGLSYRRPVFLNSDFLFLVPTPGCVFPPGICSDLFSFSDLVGAFLGIQCVDHFFFFFFLFVGCFFHRWADASFCLLMVSRDSSFTLFFFPPHEFVLAMFVFVHAVATPPRAFLVESGTVEHRCGFPHTSPDRNGAASVSTFAGSPVLACCACSWKSGCVSRGFPPLFHFAIFF